MRWSWCHCKETPCTTNVKSLRMVRKFSKYFPYDGFPKPSKSMLFYLDGFGKPSYVLPIHSLVAAMPRWGTSINSSHGSQSRGTRFSELIARIWSTKKEAGTSLPRLLFLLSGVSVGVWISITVVSVAVSGMSITIQ